MSKIIVIGGGASGLVSAICAKRNGHDVTIIEKNNKCGKKILATGNGHCNYLNNDFSIEHYRSTNIDKLNIINDESKDEILNFFESIGISPKNKNGYLYPISNMAVSVQNALIMECNRLGINILYNTELESLKYDNDFIINNEYHADKVILSTGSYVGSNGIGYDICKSFGHSLIKPLPALVSLKSDAKFVKEWAGIRIDTHLKLNENGNIIASEGGELVLTDYGVSGICAMQLSGRINRGLDSNKKEQLIIDFLPMINDSDFLNKRNKLLKGRNIVELMEGLINYKLLYVLYKSINLDMESTYDELSSNEKDKLYKVIKEFKLNIVGTKDFNDAQVCSGGIPLTEINFETMESLKQKGLYITGELQDVDGDCGGYNLGYAWLSGIIVGNKI